MVESTTLEMWQAGNGLEGSNPSLSADHEAAAPERRFASFIGRSGGTAYHRTMSFRTNIRADEEANSFYRRVLFTGERSQLVIMTIPPGTEVGEEVHPHVEQTLFFVNGNGTAVLDGEESPIEAGDVCVVTPGTRHNFINNGEEPMRIWTVYAPPNHIDGRVHETRADADADEADEKFGEEAR